MSNPNLIVIRSFADYVSAVSKINATENDSAWFRGQSSANHRLVPSALRNLVPLTSAYGRPLRGNEILTANGYTQTGVSPERMLDDFKRRALPFLDYSPKNDFEWLFLMQHHGVPTRLLDWTTNALVALYFAVSSLRADVVTSNQENLYNDADEELQEFDSNSAAVYAMNPNKVNRALHGEIWEVVDIAHDFETWKPYSRPTQLDSDGLDTYPPLCITTPQFSPRIRAQSGLFSIHGTNTEPLDIYNDVRPLLTKILIPFENAIAIQKELRQFGISESFIYPGLDGVAKDVKADEERRHEWARKDYLTKLESKSAKIAGLGFKKKQPKISKDRKPK
ncbi:FRG domain-containing protein [Cellvibrio polysaccharolyticus]|uniref:FRG domain-containing protein n=1 Tax=Cellvibrio polysaccharolyticus TaxID=2082724 RepID=A0A928UZU3_9GAMM|nr:FRG domain-containing protein [Cellvibrio polysaccharolyticus]MBE8715702.1 FRG domain-containing protein [Cellvibrio polysaccharolyticus]